MTMKLVLLALALCSAPDWKQHAPPFTAHLPADHGNHPDFRTEWWYATGEVADAEGARFGFQLTIFRQGLEPGLPAPEDPFWSVRTVYAAHVALTDIGAQKTRSAERVRRANAALAGAREGELRAWVEDWEIERDPSSGALHARARAREIGLALDLALAPTKPAVLHGERGLSEKGSQDGNASAYVSFTRLATKGALELDGRTLEVAGESWFDHEWGTSQLGTGAVGWDWFGLRLEDGRELMLYRLRRADGSALAQSGGTLVRADGSTRTLHESDVHLAVSARWKSPRSGADYPAQWTLSIPSESLELELAPRVPDCEIDGRRSTGTIYWEGPVAIAGSARGSGYAELAGYAGSLSGRF